MHEFIEREEEYLAWMTENPEGYALNLSNPPNPKNVVLHRAWCGRITSRKRIWGAYTERKYRKICANSEEELQRAAIDEGRAGGSFSKRCGCCNKVLE